MKSGNASVCYWVNLKVNILIDNKALIILQLSDEDDCSPLYYAVLENNEEVVQYLLQMVSFAITVMRRNPKWAKSRFILMLKNYRCIGRVVGAFKI